MKRLIYTLLFIISGTLALQASADYGMTSIPVLMVHQGGARALSLANSSVAYGNDLALLNVNPASMAGLKKMAFSAARMGWIFDTSYFSAAFAYPLDGAGVLALSTTVFVTEDFEMISDSSSTDTFNNGDMALGLSWAMRLDFPLEFGVTMKFVHSSLLDYSSSLLAFDLGVRYGLEVPNAGAIAYETLHFGIALRNFALVLSEFTDTSKTAVPWELDMGFQYMIFQDQRHVFYLSTSVVLPRDNEPLVSTGLEYSYLNTIYLRGGYHFLSRADEGLTFGVGLYFEINDDFAFRLDYSTRMLGDLNRSEVISLSLAF